MLVYVFVLHYVILKLPEVSATENDGFWFLRWVKVPIRAVC